MRTSIASFLSAVVLGTLLTTTPAAASVPDKPFTETLCEGYSDSVARLYTAGLGREPEQGGFDFWITEYTLGNWTFPRMAQFFVESPEFQESYGTLTQDEFIRQLYRNVLGREGEAGGIAFWNGEMTAGMSRATVLMRFAESPENIENSGTVEPILGPFNEGRVPGVWRCGPSLVGSMLNLGDFPAGWEALEVSVRTSDNEDCASSTFLPFDTEVAAFSREGDFVTSVAQGAYIAPTPHGAERYLAQMRQALVDCSVYLDGPFTIELTEMPFRSYGDDSIAVRMVSSTREEGVFVDLHAVIIQDGPVMTLVQYASGAASDPSVTEMWATIAADRIAALPFT